MTKWYIRKMDGKRYLAADGRNYIRVTENTGDDRLWHRAARSVVRAKAEKIGGCEEVSEQLLNQDKVTGTRSQLAEDLNAGSTASVTREIDKVFTAAKKRFDELQEKFLGAVKDDPGKLAYLVRTWAEDFHYAASLMPYVQNYLEASAASQDPQSEQFGSTHHLAYAARIENEMKHRLLDLFGRANSTSPWHNAQVGTEAKAMSDFRRDLAGAIWCAVFAIKPAKSAAGRMLSMPQEEFDATAAIFEEKYGKHPSAADICDEDVFKTEGTR